MSRGRGNGNKKQTRARESANRAKQPKHASKAGNKEAPKRALASASNAEDHRAANEKTPLFCFFYLDTSSGTTWSFPHDAQSLEALMIELTQLARRKWGEILQDTTGGRNRHRKNHNHPIDNLRAEGAEDYLRRQELDEIFGDELFRFRFDGEARLWGFRNGRIFHVVWWDRAHEIYPV